MNFQFIGTGDAAGVPVYGCDCGICKSARSVSPLRRRPCCALVSAGNERILLDAGVTDLLDRFPPGALTRILLTHYHVDHVQGLFPIRWGANTRIPVLGPDDPEGCADLLKHPGILDFSDTLSAFETREFGELRITPLPLTHSKPTLGYALDHWGERLAYLTDTVGLPKETEEFLQAWRPDVLVLDCSLPPQQEPPRNHNDLTRALAIHHALEPGHTYLTHIGHRLDQWLFENPGALPPGLQVASDGEIWMPFTHT